MTIFIRRPWTQQPQNPTSLRPELSALAKALVSPTQRSSTSQQTTGTPTKTGSEHGLAYSYGSGNYHSFAAGILRDSAGSGNDPTVNWSLSVSFVVTSNAATDAIFSIAVSETSATPQVLVQNNSGTLRVYFDSVGGYTDMGPAIVGRLHTVTVQYSDLSPYTWTALLNGVPIVSANAYKFWSSYGLYVGSGYPAQTANAVILQALLIQGHGADQLLAKHSTPWDQYDPLPRRIWVSSAGGSPDVSAALTGSAVTASAGTLTPSVSVSLSGQTATSSAGTLTPAVSAALSGQAATASAGTVSPNVNIALTGTAVTASAGTITYSAGNNISLTLTGSEVTASAGSLGLSSTVPVSGSSAAASAGTLNPGTSVAVSGTAVTASAGTLTYSANQDLTLALTGEAVQVSAGTITVIGGVSAVAVTGGAPGPRQQRWVVYINGKRYIGSLQEIEQLVAEFAEEQAEKAQTAKPPKKPKIKVEAGRVLGKTESAKPAQVAQQQEQVVVQQQVRDIYAEAYARAIAQMELDEEEDIISLL